MTGNDLIEEAQVRLGESLSTIAQQQSMLYPDHCRRTLDEIVRKLYSLLATSTIDFVIDPNTGVGKVEYATPLRPFRLESVRVNDGQGNIAPVAAITLTQANANYWNWSAQPPATVTYQGVPIQYIDEGNHFCLLPAPNYNCQFGLMLDGYFGVDEWYDMNTDIVKVLGIPEGYDECVVTGICWRRCKEMVRVDPTYAQLIPMYEKDYLGLLKRLYRERIGRSEATRQAIPSRGSRLGYWSGCGLWYGGA